MIEKELKEKIKASGMSRRALAEKVGMTYNYLSSMLNGFTPLKNEWRERIEAELRKGKK